MHIARIAALFALVAPVGAQKLDLPSIFSNGMVLQRGAEVPIWGRAKPGAEVVVRGGWMAEGDAGATATAGEDGRWLTTLTTPADAGPTSLTVEVVGGRRIGLGDVLLGEVWLCSGQSNMEWELHKIQEHAESIGAESGAVTGATLELDRPQVRYFDVERAFAIEPRDDVDAHWSPALGEAALDCSAVAYYFGCALQDELDVPIGLVVSSWGGTRAQAWTSAEVVRHFPDHAEAIDLVTSARDDASAQRERLDAYWSAVDDAQFWQRDYAKPSFDDSHWEKHDMPASFSTCGIGGHDGVVWYRREVDVPKRWAGQDLELVLPALDDIDQTFWNGRPVGDSVVPGAWANARKYTVPKELVEGGSAVIAVRVVDTGGAGGMAKGGAMQLRAGNEFIELHGAWRLRRGPVASALPTPPFPATVNHHTPSALFNGMLAPLVPYRVQGVIWYQGESNRSRAEEYRTLFPSMIVDWRTRFGDLELPFYFAQIAPYDYGEPAGPSSESAELRAAQALATELPMTGMVVTADIGDPRDIHPVNKWEVGRRFSLFALRDVYGKDVEPESPSVAQALREGDALTLRFDRAAEGLEVVGDSLAHFEVAGADGAFVPADASIAADGTSIRLTGVAAPVRARYLWSDDAEATLRSKDGRPVAPFSVATDG